jgi:hypothetical protein
LQAITPTVEPPATDETGMRLRMDGALTSYANGKMVQVKM